MICAFDYALSEGVNEAILDLVERKIVGAVAVLPVSDIWTRSAQSLLPLSERGTDMAYIGPSLTITAGFAPLSGGFSPDNGEQEGQLPRFEDLERAANRKKLQADVIEAEFRVQLRRFTAHLDRDPDFIALDSTALLFGPISKAATAALAHFDWLHIPVLCPSLDRPSGMTEHLRRWYWGTAGHSSEPWQRRMLMPLTDPERLPQRSSWHVDSRIWTAIWPARADERLKRLDADADRRIEQMGWFDGL